jgi:hypothetical protein
MTFLRSSAGISNYNKFSKVDLLVYSEGGTLIDLLMVVSAIFGRLIPFSGGVFSHDSFQIRLLK